MCDLEPTRLILIPFLNEFTRWVKNIQELMDSNPKLDPKPNTRNHTEPMHLPF
jgi:hypothetical protein